MTFNLNLLKLISETPGAPGFEDEVRQLVIREITPFVDSVTVDGIGNVIARKKGGETRVMAAAHMDEISLIVTGIDKSGFIRFHTLGGFDAKTLITQRVLVHGKKTLPGVIGSKPTHLMSEEEKKRVPKTEELFIDVGMAEDDVKKWVQTGTPITRLAPLFEMGTLISGKSLDNRVSVFILIEALKQATSTGVDFYAVFTVQEEVGIRGARVAAQAINPQIGICLDITVANDVPGADVHQKVTELGAGTGIKVMDGSTICTPGLVTFLSELAERNQIPYQRELLTKGGTDTSAMQYLTGVGAKVTCISTPTRYVHSTVECVSKPDVEAGIALTKKMIEEIHRYPLTEDTVS